jgi:selT/selW/selH-like putative selenoprotein
VEEEIKQAFPDAQVLAMPSASSGIFNIELDDQIIYSKGEEGRFPNPGEAIQRIKAHIG